MCNASENETVGKCLLGITGFLQNNLFRAQSYKSSIRVPIFCQILSSAAD